MMTYSSTVRSVEFTFPCVNALETVLFKVCSAKPNTANRLYALIMLPVFQIAQSSNKSVL